jgi:hypothetical protein
MKKVKNERPTWASFRHVPNDKEGQKFLTMFKKYRNLDVLRYHIRYRKPKSGTSYAHGGHCKQSDGLEFSIYTHNNTSYYAEMVRCQSAVESLQSECNVLSNCLTTSEKIAEENYKNRCDWRNSYYEVIQSSFWFWFKLRYAPFGRYLFRKLTFWRNHYA